MRRTAFAACAGMLLVSGCTSGDVDRSELAPTALAVNEMNAPAVIQRIRDLTADSLEGRKPGTTGGERTARLIAAEFRALGLRPAGDSGGFLQRVGDGANVIGVVDGELPPDSGYVLYVAHWDGVGRDANGALVPGAVDNAGGVALMVEIAGAFTRLPERPRRSVVFLAATGGEAGGTGVGGYASHPAMPMAYAIGLIELDGFNQWGKTRNVGVSAASDSTLASLLTEALAVDHRTAVRASSDARWCTPRSVYDGPAFHAVAVLRATPGSRYLGREESFAADRETEFLADRHHPMDRIRPDWDISGGLEDARALFRAGYLMTRRLSPRAVLR